jgi:amino acid permease
MLYLVIIGIGISVDNVEAVFNIVGAISATSISMLMPAYFYFALVIKKKKPLKIIFYLAIIMFVIMVPFGIFAVVAQYVK